MNRVSTLGDRSKRIVMAGWPLLLGMALVSYSDASRGTGNGDGEGEFNIYLKGRGRGGIESQAPAAHSFIGAKVSPRELLAWARQAARTSAYRAGTARIQTPPGARSGSATGSLVAEGKRLNAEILRAGSRMSPEQAGRYYVRMKQLVVQMDRKAKCQGKIGKEGPAKCMCNCGKAYPGFGGGNGWNRFWCKASCLVAKTLGK